MQRIPRVTKYKSYQARLFELSISGLEVKERRVKRLKNTNEGRKDGTCSFI